MTGPPTKGLCERGTKVRDRLSADFSLRIDRPLGGAGNVRRGNCVPDCCHHRGLLLQRTGIVAARRFCCPKKEELRSSGPPGYPKDIATGAVDLIFAYVSWLRCDEGTPGLGVA